VLSANAVREGRKQNVREETLHPYCLRKYGSSLSVSMTKICFQAVVSEPNALALSRQLSSVLTTLSASLRLNIASTKAWSTQCRGANTFAGCILVGATGKTCI
jgi:hypothetical protein